MSSQIDIYRTAQLLIAQHGAQASIQAAQRADDFNAAGNRDGFHLWMQVVAAIQEIENATVPSGTPRH